jgi:hypothetical protein
LGLYKTYDRFISYIGSFTVYEKLSSFIFAEYQILNAIKKALLCKLIEKPIAMINSSQIELAFKTGVNIR